MIPTHSNKPRGSRSDCLASKNYIYKKLPSNSNKSMRGRRELAKISLRLKIKVCTFDNLPPMATFLPPMATFLPPMATWSKGMMANIKLILLSSDLISQIILRRKLNHNKRRV